MSKLFEMIQTPEDEELARKKASLAALEAQLADRELALASCLTDLRHFEKRYLQSVGRRYALLDELKAQIAEARARQQPHSPAAREEAQEARFQAKESARAVGDESTETPSPDDAAVPSQPSRSESLNKLYRQAARQLHPDLTLDPDQKAVRHQRMAELNDAYASGSEDQVRAILRDWHASPESVTGDGPGAELIRVIRKTAQVERRLANIAAEIDQLRRGEVFGLKQQVEEAQADGRDLLHDLAERLDGDIARMREELEQVTSKGRL